MATITQAQIESAILTTADTVIRNELYFCDLDGLAGDGDFGNSLATGFKVIKADLPGLEAAVWEGPRFARVQRVEQGAATLAEALGAFDAEFRSER